MRILVTSGIPIAKAEKTLGYAPKRSWSDYLEENGKLKPGAEKKGLFGAG